MNASLNAESLILIVDDNPTNLKVLFDMLEGSGYRILMARDGQSAIERLTAVMPDLILLDVMMPGITGFETCRRIKANPLTAHIPIVFMTALAETDDKVQGFSCGAIDYITKPLQHDEVLARIKIHLELTGLQRHLEARVTERTAALELANQQLRQAQQQIEQSQLQLLQQEKMSSLGNLVAGIAHEINNPVGCINGNLPFIETYFQQLLQVIDGYGAVVPMPPQDLALLIEAIELDYIRQDFPRLLRSMGEGTARVAELSCSLRTFSRDGGGAKVEFDVRSGLDSTLMILRHRLKANSRRGEIRLLRDYGDVPLIQAYPGRINQVLMNLLANAIDVLDETMRSDRSGQIRISVRQADGRVTIAIHDNGPGIPSAVQAQIFDYLFTTKPAGQGTGLGLTISREIIVQQHGGELNVVSSPETGTTFTIALPLR